MRNNMSEKIFTSKDRRVICTIYADGTVTTFGWRPTDCPATTNPTELSRCKVGVQEIDVLEKALVECGCLPGDQALITMAR
jgi:hypothetical protein